ncbi:hypothetical protein [Halomonas nitroreducens]|uniref:Uncharacterized protein n=1 Tax=Halomonas nitroreducens TaxID=447425 RepID=A0A431V8B8_9GAMM|nr:hypothetical protein [Halomonas nitroreducens]RTR06378.1 hypothetical protein EKG36_02580 [Halomonas nitroreducens]
MAYFLVMGGLALSVCFTLGWALWRAVSWLAGRLGGGPRRRTRTRRPAARPTRRRQAEQPSAASPWRLTRAVAPLGSALPLGLVTLLLYGGSLLAAHGMAARSRPAPGAFHRLVEGLGWTAAGLLGMSLLGLVAAWRCRR